MKEEKKKKRYGGRTAYSQLIPPGKRNTEHTEREHAPYVAWIARRHRHQLRTLPLSTDKGRGEKQK